MLDWFRQWVGYPEEAAGVLVSGGSAANLTALACAREARIGAMDDQAVVYMSDQTHSSVARAARALGFRPDQVRVIPTDAARRACVRTPSKARSQPTAPTGDVPSWSSPTRVPRQPAPSIRSRSCRRSAAREAIWLHVDGAYGAFACLSERGREALAGIELADSITLDPHKWLYQPIEVGALLVRDGAALRHGFEISPAYLKDVEAVDREVNFSDLGLQLTRTCRALKLWISLRYFGVGAFRQAIDRCLDLALHAQSQIEASTELELMSPASLGVVTFRRHPAGVDDEAALERINASLAERMEQGGEVFVSTGRVRGRYVLRLCVLNHSTSQTEVDRALELAQSLPVDPAAAASTVVRESYPALEAGWLGSPTLDATALRSLPLFASLTAEQAQRVLLGAHEHLALAARSRRGAVAGQPGSLRRVERYGGGRRRWQGPGHTRPGRVLRGAGRDRLGSGLRTHARRHGDCDGADAPARPRLGARRLADQGRPRAPRTTRADFPRAAGDALRSRSRSATLDR